MQAKLVAIACPISWMIFTRFGSHFSQFKVVLTFCIPSNLCSCIIEIIQKLVLLLLTAFLVGFKQ